MQSEDEESKETKSKKYSPLTNIKPRQIDNIEGEILI